MATATLARAAPAAHPEPPFRGDPGHCAVPATVSSLARRIATLDAVVRGLPDDRLDAGQVPLFRERDRLLRSLAHTPARDLPGVGVKLRLAAAALAEGDQDGARQLVASALRDAARLSAPIAEG
jgi:hypothetical protein